MRGTSNERGYLSGPGKPNKPEFRKSRRMRYRSENRQSRASTPARACADSNRGEEENLWPKPALLIRAKAGRVQRRKPEMQGLHRAIGVFGIVVTHWRRKCRDSTYTPNASPPTSSNPRATARVRHAIRTFFDSRVRYKKNASAKEIVSGFSRDRRRA